jgi:DNA-binding NarL/FixJ family response regulator
MPYERDLPLGSLNPSERAVLEYCAEGLSVSEIAVRLRALPQEVSAIRREAASKLTMRISSAHPFQIRELVLY